MTFETLLEQFDVMADAPNGVQKVRELSLGLAFRSALSKTKASARIDSVPTGWVWRTVGDIAVSTDNGFACNKQNEVSDGYVHLRTHNVGTNGRLNFDLIVRIDPHKVHPDRATVRAGDVIFNNTNSQELVGKTCVVDRDYEFGFSNHLTRIRLSTEILPSYFVYYFNLLLRNGTFAALCNRWIGQAGINTKMLRAIRVPVAPLGEQHRIVASVDELMSFCDRLEAQQQRRTEVRTRVNRSVLRHLANASDGAELAANWERLRENFRLLYDTPGAVADLRQAVMRLAVRGKLVPQDSNDEAASVLLDRLAQAKEECFREGKNANSKHESPITEADERFALPDGWQWVRLGAISAVVGGIQKSPKRTPVANHFPYLRVANVQRGVLDLRDIERFELMDGELEKWRLEPGDLLVVEGNGSEDEIGRCARWDGEIADCVHQNHLIRVRPAQVDVGEFILRFLNSPDGIEEMKRLAVTTSGLFNLSVGKIVNIAVPIPPLAEQRRILRKLDQLMALCDELEARLTRTREKSAHLAASVVYYLTAA